MYYTGAVRVAYPLRIHCVSLAEWLPFERAVTRGEHGDDTKEILK